MDRRKSFFDAAASGWDRLNAEAMQVDKLRHMVDAFAIREGDAILDVGTGTGILLPFLGKAAGLRGTLVAIDFSLKMLQAAASRAFEIEPVFFNAGVAAIPFKAGSFDRVTCFSAFPHFPDKAKALAEMARVLKTDGVLFIAHLHSIEEITELHHGVGGSVRRDRLPHKEALARLMSEAGMADIKIENEPGRFLARGRKG
jgi:ubiquinone/menaquinone biosynthesis C-methylase UbiE